jgi:hypothetical protein
MAAPTYTLYQRFYRIEAVATRSAQHGQPADPIRLQVEIKNSLGEVVEVVSPGPRLRAVRQGVWLLELDEAILTPTASYSAYWQYEVIPGVRNTIHQGFTFRAVPETPYDVGNVVLFGQLRDASGLPAGFQSLVIEDFKDFGTLTQRLSATDVTSDAFGNWWYEVPQNKTLRIVLGTLSRIVKTPAGKSRVALSELPAYQPGSIVRRDRFGYPVPGLDDRLPLEGLSVEQPALPPAPPDIIQPPTPPTPPGGGQSYEHTQSNLSTVWSITHNLDTYPTVIILDENGDDVEGDVQYADRNSLTISFLIPLKGTAILR